MSKWPKTSKIVNFTYFCNQRFIEKIRNKNSKFYFHKCLANFVVHIQILERSEENWGSLFDLKKGCRADGRTNGRLSIGYVPLTKSAAELLKSHCCPLRHCCALRVKWPWRIWLDSTSSGGGRFKNTYELLNLRALKFSLVNKIHIFQCMGKMLYVEFQRYPLKFHTKYLTHTLKDMIFLRVLRFTSSYAFLKRPPEQNRLQQTRDVYIFLKMHSTDISLPWRTIKSVTKIDYYGFIEFMEDYILQYYLRKLVAPYVCDNYLSPSSLQALGASITDYIIFFLICLKSVGA